MKSMNPLSNDVIVCDIRLTLPVWLTCEASQAEAGAVGRYIACTRLARSARASDQLCLQIPFPDHP